MKIIFLTTILFSVIELCLSDTKMKIKILPPEEDSKEPTRYLLNRFKNVMNDGMSLRDSPLLNKINPETIKSSLHNIDIMKVIAPINCESIGGCNKDLILEELAEFLNVPMSRLRVNIKSKY